MQRCHGIQDLAINLSRVQSFEPASLRPLVRHAFRLNIVGAAFRALPSCQRRVKSPLLRNGSPLFDPVWFTFFIFTKFFRPPHFFSIYSSNEGSRYIPQFLTAHLSKWTRYFHKFHIPLYDTAIRQANIEDFYKKNIFKNKLLYIVSILLFI